MGELVVIDPSALINQRYYNTIDYINGRVGVAADFIESKISRTENALQDAINRGSNQVQDSIWNVAQQGNYILDKVQSTFDKIPNNLSSSISYLEGKAVENVRQVLDVLDGINSLPDKVANKINESNGAVVDGITQGFSLAAGTLSDTMTSNTQKTNGFLDDIGKGIVESLFSMISGISAPLKAGSDAIKNTIEDFDKNISGGFGNLNKLCDTGIQIIDDGINSVVDTLINFALDIWNGFTTAITSLLDVKPEDIAIAISKLMTSMTQANNVVMSTIKT